MSTPGDKHEQEAERAAREVTRMPAAGIGYEPGEASRGETQTSSGKLLDPETRAFFEPRFGHSFANVRVHAGPDAALAALAVNAKAFTVGDDIVFGAGRYSPSSREGQHLLAHELTHVVQQNNGSAAGMLQRECDDPTFCTPYDTWGQAASVEALLRTTFLPAMNLKFGSEVRDLWESFLDRSPGDSLSPTIFDTAGNPIEESFAGSWAVEDDQEEVLDLVASRLSRFPGGHLKPHTTTMASLTNFLSQAEMDDRPIDFSNSLSKAGNIAGGIGSSDAGPDSRRIARANVVLEKVPIIGDSGYIHLTLVPHYEVIDAVDLCPGKCGAPAEQIFTIPLSRLEESGQAYDVPYIVKFAPEPVTDRVFFTTFPI